MKGGERDLFIRRIYTHNGISICVEIDLARKMMTLVEPDKHEGGFRPKSWYFAERTIEYLPGWERILTAMSHAIQEGAKILNEEEDRDKQEFTDLMIAISEPKLKKGKSE